MNDASAEPTGDYILPFQIETPGIRGRLVRLGPAIEAIAGGDRYPAPVARLLAETLAMGAVLASGLKYDGIFTLQLQGDGPVGVVMMDVTSDGDMRGYAQFAADRLNARLAPGALPLSGPVPRLLGAGQMVFTVDQGPNTERYQGVTLLEGATIADCTHAYFRQSEQLQTAVCLAATDPAVETEAPRSAALMLQRLPPASPLAFDADDDWRRAVVLLSSLTPAELLTSNGDDDAMLYRLFHEDGVRVYPRRLLRHRCRCSQRKVERALCSFPIEEVKALLIDGVVTVTCEFCKKTYVFDEPMLDRLYAAS